MTTSLLTRRVQSALLLRDLPRYLAAFSQHFGVPAPKLDFRYADALSQRDATSIYEWGLQIPAIRTALRHTGNVDHRETRAFADMLNYFRHEHPADAATGEPITWTTIDPAAALSPPMRAHILEGANLKAAELAPAEAAGVLAWVEGRSDFAADAMNKSHPQQEQLAREMLELRERAQAAPAAGKGAEPAGEQVTAAMTEARAAIAAKQGDEKFMAVYKSKFAEGHRNAVAEMQRLHEAAYPEAPAKGAPVSAPSGTARSGEDAGAATSRRGLPAGFETRVAKLRQDLAALPKGDARREPLQAELTREYQSAYPEPAPAPAPSSGGG